MSIKSLTSSSMLVDLNISTYTGRKQDKAVAEEVNQSKNAKSKKATSVSKSLFADDKDLEAITAQVGRVRVWLYEKTLPWSDSGTRLVPTKSFFDLSSKLSDYEREFNNLVDTFINNYSTKVSAQAFKLGQLFDPDEYPTAAQIGRKFSFNYRFSPVPSSGDFRVDIPAQAIDQLREQFERDQNERIKEVFRDPWERLHTQIMHIRDKMISKEDGKPQKLYESMLTNSLELCETLKILNVADDPDLEEARRLLESSLSNVDITSLRKSPEMRESIKKKMDDLTEKFSFDL